MQKCAEITMWGRNLSYDDLLWLYNKAVNFGLKGATFFKNDGSIKIIAEGAEENLLFFIKKIKKGRSFFYFFSPIENFSVVWKNAKNDFDDFSISESGE